MCNSTLLGRGKTLFTQTLEEDMMMCSLAERCDELQETCDSDPTVVFPGLGCFLMRFSFSYLSSFLITTSMIQRALCPPPVQGERFFLAPIGQEEFCEREAFIMEKLRSYPLLSHAMSRDQ